MGLPVAFVLTAVLTFAFAAAYAERRARTTRAMATQYARFCALLIAHRTRDALLIPVLEEVERPQGEDLLAEIAEYFAEAINRLDSVDALEDPALAPRDATYESLMDWIGEELEREREQASSEKAA